MDEGEMLEKMNQAFVSLLKNSKTNVNYSEAQRLFPELIMMLHK